MRMLQQLVDALDKALFLGLPFAVSEIVAELGEPVSQLNCHCDILCVASVVSAPIGRG
jgi:hypothetical protein